MVPRTLHIPGMHVCGARGDFGSELQVLDLEPVADRATTKAVLNVCRHIARSKGLLGIIKGWQRGLASMETSTVSPSTPDRYDYFC